MDFSQATDEDLNKRINSQAMMAALWLNEPEHEKYAREAAAEVLAIHQEILRRIEAEQADKS